MRTQSSASQQVETPTADLGWKILNTSPEKIHLLSVHIQTHTATQFFCLGGPQTLNTDLSHKEKQRWIYIHGACYNWTLQVKCATWTTSTCWLCSTGSRSQISKQDTVHITPHPCYHCTAYQSQATKMFPRTWGVLLPFHSCYVSGNIVSR